MLLHINGNEQTMSDVATLADVIKTLGYEGDFFAVALNRTCVLRTKYAATSIKENDEIEILSPMQGG